MATNVVLLDAEVGENLWIGIIHGDICQETGTHAQRPGGILDSSAPRSHILPRRSANVLRIFSHQSG